jgi:hypothetical protein
MLFKRLVVICALPSFLVGCAEFYGSQPPAPVLGAQTDSQQPVPRVQKKTKSRKTPSKQIVKTQPLKGFSEIKSEPLSPPEPLTSEPLTIESAPAETPEPSLPPPSPAASEAQVAPLPPPAPAAAASKESEPSSIPPSSLELTPFEPMEDTAPLSPAVGALISAANESSQTGDLDSSAASIERAIRIEPRNATLFYKLALLRLKQSKPRLAEDLAKKSALLASTDNTLKRHCWLLIAHARELQQDFTGAKKAREKADGF